MHLFEYIYFFKIKNIKKVLLHSYHKKKKWILKSNNAGMGIRLMIWKAEIKEINLIDVQSGVEQNDRVGNS